jgi:TonB-linked SusC/RagA family outer membrane protein
VSAASTRIGSTSTYAWSMLSYMSRLNYNYKQKYLLQASFRRDGSSRFGKLNKWANFPSVSAGWVVSEEDFFNEMNTPANFLKLRASYGLTGNNNIGNYTHLAAVGTANYVNNGTLVPGKSLSTTMGNSELTWENSKQFNGGIDLGLFKDRIFIMYDYYNKVTDGLLYQLDVPRASGFANIQYNVGRIDFWGHEVSIETKNLVGDFKWNTNLNMSFNRNEVKALGTNNVPVGGTSLNGNFNRLEVGQPVGVFMGFINDGVYMTQDEFNTQPKHASSTIGSVRYKDISGPNGTPDGVIDMNDRTIIGNPNPDMVFGITNTFNWKNFDMSIVMTGVIGGDIIARSYENTHNLDGVFNVTRDALDRWRSEENPGAGIVPRTLVGTTQAYRYNNTRWVSDGTHLSLKNITIGYTLPKSKLYSNARVYVSGQQLYILTNYTGGNPEVSSSMNWNGLGVDNTAYPVPSTYSVGLSVTF